jgi:hypothetical protein
MIKLERCIKKASLKHQNKDDHMERGIKKKARLKL